MNTQPFIHELPAPPEGRHGWPWTPTAVAPNRPPSSGGEWPRVTIVTPSYNQGRFLEGAIRSVLLQGYPNLEYIVMDGGSTDESVAVIRRYAPWLSHWVSAPDGGQSAALRTAFERASGSVLAWVNSDDSLMPNALHTVAALRANHPDCVAWIGACQELDDHDRPLRLRLPRVAPDAIGDWSGASSFYQPSCLFDAEAYRRAGGLKDRYSNCMDIDLWVRLAEQGPFATTSAVLSAARLYADAKTFRDASRRECELIAINMEHGAVKTACNRLERLMAQGGVKPLRAQPFADVADRVRCRDVVAYLARRTLRKLFGWCAGDRAT
jgi:GT2 family glycosyltransferase